MSVTLTALVTDAAQRHPDGVALRMGGASLTYRELMACAAQAAVAVPPLQPDEPPLVFVWASADPASYVAVLAALLSGRGYVPLNPEFPDSRLDDIVARTGARVLLVPAADRAVAEERLQGRGADLQVLTVAVDSPVADELPDLPTPDPDALAYVLFTSGSTGVPKGVPVRHRHAVPLITYMVELYGIGQDDVCSQMFELTFDLSVHSVFTAWAAGATLAVPEKRQRMVPGAFIRSAGLTIWYSVPSVTDFLRRLGQLKPGAYPELRAVLFCGEVLSRQAALAWQAAAPNAVLDNHYGPTEAAMSVTGYRFDAEAAAQLETDVVPIGTPYPGVGLHYADEALVEVPPGATGELLLGGRQVVDGYWRDEQRTRAAFVELPWVDGPVYRTGDRVRRPLRPEDPVHYVGRTDNQVKIFGIRIELGEVESTVRELTGHDAVAALPWPKTQEGYGGIHLFVGTADELQVPELLDELRTRLPPYVVPKQVHVLPRLPLNSNGKIDRPALRATLEEAP